MQLNTYLNEFLFSQKQIEVWPVKAYETPAPDEVILTLKTNLLILTLIW